ncbi:hypothetical protein HDU81_010911 [Chytriomyces hyalinus]|nr:hypothetical protein HDU81_010911 [Chytriomyces hyalinus]
MIKIAVASVLSIATGALIIPYLPATSLFAAHPISMGVFVASSIGAVAVLQRTSEVDKAQEQRANNLEVHAALQAIATVAAGMGLYAIYGVKEATKKPHLTSVHGKAGAVVFGLMVGVAVFGALIKNGVVPKKFTKVHRGAGFITLFSAVSVAALGLVYYTDKKQRGGVIAALFGLTALFGLFNTVSPKFAAKKRE